MQYDVTTITVRPGTAPKAIAKLEAPLTAGHAGRNLLACWYSEIGALNQILIIRNSPNLAEAVAEREAVLKSGNPFGIGEFIAGMTMDTFTPFDFLKPMQPGTHGPFFEVRTYILKPEGLMPTIALWQKALPARAAISPLLTAMSSVSDALHAYLAVYVARRPSAAAREIRCRRRVAAARRSRSARRDADRHLSASRILADAVRVFWLSRNLAAKPAWRFRRSLSPAASPEGTF
jgi:hypothetical protein